MLNLAKSIRVNTRAESSSFAWDFFIDSVKSAWQAGLLPSLGRSHRLQVALCRFGKRLSLHWPRIFRVTGLMFLPRKFKFTVRILV